MANPNSTNITLADGQTELGPWDPRTWSADERLKARWLNTEVGAPVFWHRQRPFFQALQSVSQTLSTGSPNSIDLDWEIKDTAGGHNDPSNLDRWNAPVTAHPGSAGNIYLCIGYVPTATQSTANTVTTSLSVNDGSLVREGTRLATNTGHATTGMVIELLNLTPNDWVSLSASTTNSNVGTVVSAKTPSLSVRWVSAINGVLASNVTTPHTWIGADQVTADDTGSSPALGGSKVPLNKEIRSVARFLNLPPVARLTTETLSAQSIPSSSTAWTSINFGWSFFDSFSGWSSSDPSKYFFPFDGLYFVAGYYSTGESASGNTGYRAVRLQVNGDSNKVYGGTTVDATKATQGGTAIYAAHHIRVKAGDYVQVQAQQTHSAAKPINTGAANACRLIVVWMSQ